MAEKRLRINELIKVPEVRLINADGSQAGVVTTTEALESAQKADLDLVEVSPMAKPPVCKILNYGKFKFDQEKRQKEQQYRPSQSPQ